MNAPISTRSVGRRGRGRRRNSGTVMVFCLLSLAVLAVLAANLVRTALPRFHITYQAAGWQEARLAAEAGIDLVIQKLNANIPDPSLGSWSGWTKADGTAAAGSNLGRSSAVLALGGVVGAGNALSATPPIQLDNVAISGNKATVDVRLWALYPSNDPADTTVWYKARAMGVCGFSGPKRSPADRMDSALRRLNLLGMRPTMAVNDIGTPSPVALPNASRVIEVMIRPVFLFSRALISDDSPELGQGNNWEIFSYDSTDPAKSDNYDLGNGGGVPPDEDSDKIQSNGDIGTNADLIAAEGAVVEGDADTNGGDDPTTAAHENVTDGEHITGDIGDQFDEELPPLTRPAAPSITSDPDYSAGAPFIATPGATTYYHIGASDPPLGSFSITGSGKVVLFIDGDWNLGTGNGSFVIIPPTVQCTVYVRGNIEFGNGEVNTNGARPHGDFIPYDGEDNKSSVISDRLFIIGEEPQPDVDGTIPVRTLDGSGSAVVAAAFYGPDYLVNLNGDVVWAGALVCKDYEIEGGGNGGLAYDEKLGSSGRVQKFEIASYYEDSRQ